MQQKKIIKMTSATLLVIAALAGCSGPRDITLSAMNEPENSKKLLETLSAEEQTLLRQYVVKHSMAGDLDQKKTIKQAIEAQKAEAADEAKGKAMISQIK